MGRGNIKASYTTFEARLDYFLKALDENHPGWKTAPSVPQAGKTKPAPGPTGRPRIKYRPGYRNRPR